MFSVYGVSIFLVLLEKIVMLFLMFEIAIFFHQKIGKIKVEKKFQTWKLFYWVFCSLSFSVIALWVLILHQNLKISVQLVVHNSCKCEMKNNPIDCEQNCSNSRVHPYTGKVSGIPRVKQGDFLKTKVPSE